MRVAAHDLIRLAWSLMAHRPGAEVDPRGGSCLMPNVPPSPERKRVMIVVSAVSEPGFRHVPDCEGLEAGTRPSGLR